MSSVLIMIFAVLLFVIAFFTYGRKLRKEWGLDNSNTTPAHHLQDGVDYVPTESPVLLGHHFASIAGAAPIIGPVTAATFGWVPVLAWIVIGGIFMGGVHDMGSLVSSIRNDGRSIGEVINRHIGETGKKLFSVFAWLTLVLIIAAFMSIAAETFYNTPSAATSSVLFIVLAILYGLIRDRSNISLGSLTVIGVLLLFICVWIGLSFPLQLPESTWLILSVIYIFIASVTPVWILLQPRDYLNSFLLYALLLGGFLGVVIGGPSLELSAFTSFKTSTGYMFPILFVTIACGAISGFHSLVASGTTAKQLNKETDAHLIGYGGMLIECTLAVIALLTAAVVTTGSYDELLAGGGPVNVFSHGIGQFLANIGISTEVGMNFAALAVSAFALTTLDTATRLGRFIFQEYFTDDAEEVNNNALSNMYVATFITVIFAASLAFTGHWNIIWPIFGSANQLLAALALLSLSVWLADKKINNLKAIIPMIFMFAVTLTALVLVIKDNLLAGGSITLGIIGLLLFALAIVLLKQSYRLLSSEPGGSDISA